jgi:hypothetical protein
MFPRVDPNYMPYHTQHYVETTSICCRPRIANTIRKVLEDYQGDCLRNSCLFSWVSGNVLVIGHDSSIAASNFALSGLSIYVGQCTISRYDIRKKDQLELNKSEKHDDFVLKSDKYVFEPVLIGDPSHLSDPTNLRNHPVTFEWAKK